MKTSKFKLSFLFVTIVFLFFGASMLYGFQCPTEIVPVNPNLPGQRIKAILMVYYEPISETISCDGIRPEEYKMNFGLWATEEAFQIITGTVTADSSGDPLCPFNAEAGCIQQSEALVYFMENMVYNSEHFCEAEAPGEECTGAITSVADGNINWSGDPSVSLLEIRFVVSQP
jgi:hypothetical protein